MRLIISMHINIDDKLPPRYFLYFFFLNYVLESFCGVFLFDVLAPLSCSVVCFLSLLVLERKLFPIFHCIY